MKTFWDFCAPFYDFAEKNNGTTYAEMLQLVRAFVPQGATALEAAAGTGAISLAIADRASQILCTDVSEKMLKVARRKAKKRGVRNIAIENRNIFALGEADNSFDIIIAGQVLHLVDLPELAAAELKRVAKSTVILPMCLLKDLRGKAKLSVRLWKLLGFEPKIEFDTATYAEFLPKIGFDGCEIVEISGKMPMVVAIWRKANNN